MTVAGNPTKEIRIQFDFDTIQMLDMDLSLVVAQLRGAFVKMPADKKDVDGRLYSFEITSYGDDLNNLVDQVKNLDVMNLSGRTIKIDDIADVYLGSVENPKKTFLLSGGDTINAIGFSVGRTPGFDIQTVTLELKEKVEAFKSANPELTTVEIQSSEEIIDQTYNLFLENFRETGLFVFIVVVVFLGRGSSIIVLISFLIVYLINFAVLKAL